MKKSKSLGFHHAKKGIFGSILKFWKGNDETQKFVEEVDDSEKIRISTEGLRCSICFSVFGSAPTILPCGHSFCVNCIQVQVQQAIYQAPAMHAPKFECAMCRHSVSVQVPLPKNYAVETILNSVELLEPDEPLTEKEAVNVVLISLDRANKQVKEAEERVSNLKKKNLELKRMLKILFPFTCVSIAMLFYVFLKQSY